jgi:hypothetical protein
MSDSTSARIAGSSAATRRIEKALLESLVSVTPRLTDGAAP